MGTNPDTKCVKMSTNNGPGHDSLEGGNPQKARFNEKMEHKITETLRKKTGIAGPRQTVKAKNRNF